ncbi:MAG: DNA (cytosine-5-)-methyltransferase, partial [Ardenticatenales bacterium]|nr:DNA (cytosine-5-)-methyltransferase [Ardenticatenales bacterium]
MTQRQLTIVSLFSGIGGFERGLEEAGHHTLQFWELMPEAQACLRQHFPLSKIEADGDITQPKFPQSLPERFDVLTAGFPCQDLSQAGRMHGLSGSRSGLILRVLDVLAARPEHCRPAWLLLENVAFMRHLDSGSAMRVILERLTKLGYDWAYRQVDSNAFGLPQRRKRIYFAACRPDAGDPRTVLFADDGIRPARVMSPGWLDGTACGFYWTEGNRGIGWGYDLVPALKVGSSFQMPSPPAILHPREGIVTPTITDAEALQGFERGWTSPAEGVNRDRNGRSRWHLIGNAVSVPVSKWLGYRLSHPIAPLPTLIESATPLWPGAK